VYYRHKNPKIALSYVNKLLLQSPSHIPGLKLKAHILAELEEFDQSAALLKELVEQNPNNADLVLLLGSVLHKAGKWQEALQTYQTLLDSDPSDSKNVRFQIYQVYVDEGMFEKAIATLNQILTEETGTISQTKLRTEMANCYCRKADDSFERGLLNDAMESYNKAKEWDENHQGIYMGLGKLYCQQEDYDKASEAYKRVMDLGVADESLYLEIASIYERMDRFDEAISYLKSIERTNPSAQIFYYLGTLYGLKGDMENCIDYLNKTIHRSPRFVDAYYNLGVAYEQHKRIKEAINMYKKVLELDSSHEEAKANLKFLKSKQYKPSV
jgi:tetratricopeptide (TPR) repeat protein